MTLFLAGWKASFSLINGEVNGLSITLFLTIVLFCPKLTHCCWFNCAVIRPHSHIVNSGMHVLIGPFLGGTGAVCSNMFFPMKNDCAC